MSRAGSPPRPSDPDKARRCWRIAIVAPGDSWLRSYAEELAREWLNERHAVRLCQTYEELVAGDLAFFLGCLAIAPADVLLRNVHNLAVHESPLPEGRGFAPVAWQVLRGQNRIPMVLFEAVEEPDAGPIYLRDELVFEGHELLDEIRRQQGEKTMALCREFVRCYPNLVASPQVGGASVFPRRRPSDSRLDPDKTIREQFPLLRIADNERYPAFFEIEGHRYTLSVEKARR